MEVKREEEPAEQVVKLETDIKMELDHGHSVKIEDINHQESCSCVHCVQVKKEEDGEELVDIKLPQSQQITCLYSTRRRRSQKPESIKSEIGDNLVKMEQGPSSSPVKCPLKDDLSYISDDDEKIDFKFIKSEDDIQRTCSRKMVVKSEDSGGSGREEDPLGSTVAVKSEIIKMEDTVCDCSKCTENQGQHFTDCPLRSEAKSENQPEVVADSLLDSNETSETIDPSEEEVNAGQPSTFSQLRRSTRATGSRPTYVFQEHSESDENSSDTEMDSDSSSNSSESSGSDSEAEPNESRRRPRPANSRLDNATPRPFPCPHCSLAFTTQYRLNIHLTKVHTSNSTHRCPQCTQTFPTSFKLHIHERIHNKSVPLPPSDNAECFHCSQCDWAFTNKLDMKRHMRTHTGERPYVCDQCNRRFSLKHNLTVHKARHSGEKPFTCTTCSSSFLTKNQLIVHQRIHTGERPFRCPDCPKAFTHKHHLVDHTRTHSGSKPFSCEQCAKKFTTASELVKHLKRHTGEKVHGCGQCSKRFVTKVELRDHQRVHTGSRPFRCTEEGCTKSFTQKSNLKTHLVKMHKKSRQHRT